MSTQRKLVVKTKTTIVPDSGDHRFRFWVHEAVDIDPKIFIYQRVPATGSPGYTDIFTNIASASDLITYAADAPATGDVFFRLSSGDLLYKSVALLESFAETLQTDVRNLILNLDRLDTMGDENIYTFTGSVIP